MRISLNYFKEHHQQKIFFFMDQSIIVDKNHKLFHNKTWTEFSFDISEKCVH